MTSSGDIARGPGPTTSRYLLIAIAVIYFGMLLRPPELHGRWRALAFFAQSTALFPRRDEFSIEFRIEAWSCTTLAWVPMDMRPYFPMRADDKESRFQRLAYFYDRDRMVMTALDDYLVARHNAGDAGDDAASGPIGGIRVYEVKHAIPALGTTIERYTFDPLGAVAAADRSDKYWTKSSKRSQRCGKAVPATDVAPPADSSSSPVSGDGQ